MNSETTPSQAEKSSENEEGVELKAEVLDRIKHPPSIADAMMELSPEERASNPAVVPQMYDESGDLRDDRKRDD